AGTGAEARERLEGRAIEIGRVAEGSDRDRVDAERRELLQRFTRAFGTIAVDDVVALVREAEAALEDGERALARAPVPPFDHAGLLLLRGTRDLRLIPGAQLIAARPASEVERQRVAVEARERVRDGEHEVGAVHVRRDRGRQRGQERSPDQ